MRGRPDCLRRRPHTARDTGEDRIAGITAGGDDYVAKPFSLEEVPARLRGPLRRAGMSRQRANDALLTVGDLGPWSTNWPRQVRSGCGSSQEKGNVRSSASVDGGCSAMGSVRSAG